MINPTRKMRPNAVFLVLIFLAAPVFPLHASIIMQDSFDDGVLTGWVVDLSPSGGSVTEDYGCLNIYAHGNAYAHVEKENDIDGINARARIKIARANTGSRWAPGLALYWGPGNWIRAAIDGVEQGVLVTHVVGSALEEQIYRVIDPRRLYQEYIWVAVEITNTHVSVFYSQTGTTWTRLFYCPRPSVFRGAPAKVILGKGFGTSDYPLNNPDLDNDSADVGGLGASWIDDFLVTKDEKLVEGPFLRRFPFPYRAGLAIASDVDGMSGEEFLAIHQFLNTKENTSLNIDPENTAPMGVGVGLSIASSFWMYSDNDGSTVADGMSYFHFDGTSAVKSEDADLIRTYFHAGYIDCIHSFGHFGRTGGFTRELAVAAIEEMKRSDIMPYVWTNHGDGYDFDNLGHLWNIRNLGDVPESDAYHSDMSVAPDGPIKFLWNYKANGLVDLPVANPVAVEKLYDGKTIMTFRRFFGPGWLPEDLGSQLSDAMLDSLVANEGYMIVANHLGARGWPVPVFLDSNAIAGFRRLENRHRSGDIYVTTTSNLLWYNMIRFYAKWSWEGNPDASVTLCIDGIDDPVGGSFIPTLDDLQGLTFYIPFDGELNVVLAGEDVTDSLAFNAIDSLGFASVTFPLRALPPLPEWISDGYTRKTEDYKVPEYDYTIDIVNIDDKPHSPTLSYVGLHSFEVQEVKQGELYHIWVPDSTTVHLPRLAAGESIESLEIPNGPYRSDNPRLVSAIGDSAEVERATYHPDSSSAIIVLVGAGLVELRLENNMSPFLGATNIFDQNGHHIANTVLNGRKILRTVNMEVVGISEAIGITIDDWCAGEGSYKRWRQEASGDGSVGYEIGDLAPVRRHAVKANGLLLGTHMSDEEGRIRFRCDLNGPTVVLEVTDMTDPGRSEFWMTNVSPNPFVHLGGRLATCLFANPETNEVNLSVFDASGRLVAKLIDKSIEPGVHEAQWNGSCGNGEPVPSGVYFFRLEIGRNVAQSKVVVLK